MGCMGDMFIGYGQNRHIYMNEGSASDHTTCSDQVQTLSYLKNFLLMYTFKTQVSSV